MFILTVKGKEDDGAYSVAQRAWSKSPLYF